MDARAFKTSDYFLDIKRPESGQAFRSRPKLTRRRYFGIIIVGRSVRKLYGIEDTRRYAEIARFGRRLFGENGLSLSRITHLADDSDPISIPCDLSPLIGTVKLIIYMGLRCMG